MTELETPVVDDEIFRSDFVGLDVRDGVVDEAFKIIRVVD